MYGSPTKNKKNITKACEKPKHSEKKSSNAHGNCARRAPAIKNADIFFRKPAIFYEVSTSYSPLM